MTPLNWLSGEGYKRCIEMLIEKGCDVNEKDEMGTTALHRASENGYTEVVEFLLEKGASVNEKNKDGMTALCMAFTYNHEEVVEVLLKKGADINEIVKILLKEKYNTNEQTEYAANLLNRIVYFDNSPEIIKIPSRPIAVKALLSVLGINVNAKFSDGDTLLHYTTYRDFPGSNNVKIVKVLLSDSNINVNQKNKDGNTPLHLAAHSHNLEIIKALLSKQGIDINVKNSSNRTPIDEARIHYVNNRFISFLTWDYGSECITLLENAKLRDNKSLTS